MGKRAYFDHWLLSFKQKITVKHFKSVNSSSEDLNSTTLKYFYKLNLNEPLFFTAVCRRGGA